MRAISKILAVSTVAAAALAVSACGPKTETTTENTMVTDMSNTGDAAMGDTMTDNMTAVDGASNGGMMANDSSMMSGGNDAMMMSNSTTTTNAM